MGSEDVDLEALLVAAKQMVASIESGEVDNIHGQIADISAFQNDCLFQELGQMTRELHESIVSFRMDTRISGLAETDIPDAKERLEHVISMTEESADKTLESIEKILPVSDELMNKLTTLSDSWALFRKKSMSIDDFKVMALQVDQFFLESNDALSDVQRGLNEILMAQGFQDLTGQIIRRVITLVDEIESNLVELIRVQGEQIIPVDESSSEPELAGPQIPGMETETAVTSQDEVDDLLASLGF